MYVCMYIDIYIYLYIYVHFINFSFLFFRANLNPNICIYDMCRYIIHHIMGK